MNHTPSINDVVDVLTARMEATNDSEEREAMRRALVEVERYVFRQHRLTGFIDRVIRHIQRKAA